MEYELHDYSDRIKVLNDIMVDKSRNRGENCLHDKLKKGRKRDLLIFLIISVRMLH